MDNDAETMIARWRETPTMQVGMSLIILSFALPARFGRGP
jgi:hypothetical protein